MINGKVYYNFYEYCLDVENQQLLKSGSPVKLNPKAFQVLLLLIQNSGQITKKEDIFNELWSDSFVEESNLTQNIYVLRKILEKTPNGKSFIETVPKRGYRFTLEPNEISVIKSTQPVESETSQDQIGSPNSNEKSINKVEGKPVEICSPGEAVFNKTAQSDLTGKHSKTENRTRTMKGICLGRFPARSISRSSQPT